MESKYWIWDTMLASQMNKPKSYSNYRFITVAILRDWGKTKYMNATSTETVYYKRMCRPVCVLCHSEIGLGKINGE